jgi:hypothetical protein
MHSSKSFNYYGKDIPIPEIGDIIYITYSNFSSYFIEISSVELGAGKKGTFYKGYILNQKGFSHGGMAPAFVKSKDDFERSGKSVTVYPKEKNRVLQLIIWDFS